MKNIFFILSLGFVLSSCETLINDVSPEDIGGLEEKLAVSCFISPDDKLVKAYLFYSQPLFSEVPSSNTENSYTSRGTNGSLVTLHALDDSSNKVTLSFDITQGAYTFTQSPSSLEIKAAKSYQLEVRDGDHFCKAITTVPKDESYDLSTNVSIKTDSFGFEGDTTSFLNLRTQVAWFFDRENTSFFRLRGFVKNTFKGEETNEVIESTNDLFFEDYGLLNGTSPTVDTSPSLAGSATINTKQTFFFNPQDPTLRPRTTTVSLVELGNLEIELLSISESYYQFYSSIDDNRSENPFVEPTPVYSNIEGGLGIFGANLRVGKKDFNLEAP